MKCNFVEDIMNYKCIEKSKKVQRTGLNQATNLQSSVRHSKKQAHQMNVQQKITEEGS